MTNPRGCFGSQGFRLSVQCAHLLLCERDLCRRRCRVWMPNGKLICSFRVRLVVDTRPRRPDQVAPRFDRLTLRKRPRRNVLREPNGMRLIILYSLFQTRMAASSVTAAAKVCMIPATLAYSGAWRSKGRSGGSTSAMVRVSALVVLAPSSRLMGGLDPPSRRLCGSGYRRQGRAACSSKHPHDHLRAA